ncbi:hypothetical protein FF38_14453 [Lucilia cuprina]|uniref:Acylphosphatase-like domain-containing protein n=1 Tax=Lucilia cuprina TaxID=7375 RepID=A0A0L0C0Z7_LUCCU|nr:uncharacterized protein LOC111677546 [Lucilia cuprina]KAI8128086.1 hypothetical protein CVS40_2290 [Lucilia cuprina]KNC25998.1 hypothetical protein FF38_14453 [Lucilia cuprina]
MSHQIFSRDFHIEANIPEGLFEAFMVAQAKLLNLKGNIEKTAQGFKGHLEGEKETMEKLQYIVEKAEQFLSKIKTMIFSELKEIKQYTVENFSVKK